MMVFLYAEGDFNSFNLAWQTMDTFGFADQIGSVEYHRVFATWLEKQRPSDIFRFIYDEVNRQANQATI
jgi:hypothetical protein